MLPLNFMTNWLEDNLNAEQLQQESTPFSGEIDASKQHQQTWPAITLEGVLRWEHHYRLCVVCWIKVASLGFDRKSLVPTRVGVCCSTQMGIAQSHTNMLFSGQIK